MPDRNFAGKDREAKKAPNNRVFRLLWSTMVRLTSTKREKAKLGTHDRASLPALESRPVLLLFLTVCDSVVVAFG